VTNKFYVDDSCIVVEGTPRAAITCCFRRPKQHRRVGLQPLSQAGASACHSGAGLIVAELNYGERYNTLQRNHEERAATTNFPLSRTAAARPTALLPPLMRPKQHRRHFTSELQRSIATHATRLRTAYIALAGLQRLMSCPLQSYHTTPVQHHIPPVSPSQYEHVRSRSCCTVL